MCQTGCYFLENLGQTYQFHSYKTFSKSYENYLKNSAVDVIPFTFCHLSHINIWLSQIKFNVYIYVVKMFNHKHRHMRISKFPLKRQFVRFVYQYRY